MILRFSSPFVRSAFAVMMLLALPRASAEQTGITVLGSGVAKGKPTQVQIEATVSGEAELTNDAMVKYRDAKKRAIAAVEGLKLPNLTVESTGVSVSEALDPNTQQQMMQGRFGTAGKPKVLTTESLKIVIKEIDKTATDALLDTVMKVIDTGRDAGLQIGPPMPTNWNQYNNMMNNGQGLGQGMLQFKIGDSSVQRDQAYKDAMEDAKKKAQRLADLAGVKLGKIVSVQDSMAMKNGNVNMAAWMNAYGGGTQTDISDLSSHMLTDISLKVTLSVQFEIAK